MIVEELVFKAAILVITGTCFKNIQCRSNWINNMMFHYLMKTTSKRWEIVVVQEE